MTFTNLRQLIACAGLSLLAACSSVDGLPGMTTPESSNHDAKKAQSSSAAEPFRQRASQLRSQPNQYQGNKIDVPEQATVQFNQAMELKRQEKFSEAQGAFAKLSEDYPMLSGPWLQLADLSLLQTEDPQQAAAQAIKQLEKALTLNPHSYFAHNRLATLLRHEGQFLKAEMHYQQAIDSWPGFPEAYVNKGILYDLYLGDKLQALENYQLYQALLEEPDPRVKGWIADLSRQLKVIAQKESAE